MGYRSKRWRQTRTKFCASQEILNQNMPIKPHSQNPSLLNTWAAAISAITFAFSAMIYPQGAVADEKFTAADVLIWDSANQDGYFEVSIAMAAALASQNQSQQQAACIDKWYFDPSVDRIARNNEVRAAMQRFASYHPTLVMIAVIEKACGELVFRN